MKSIIVSMLVAAGLLAAGSAMALDSKLVGTCGACHNMDSDKKKVGPGWVAVAKKHNGDAKAIAANITKGGKFGWNMGMMPAKGGNSKLTEADIDAIAKHIAGLK